MIATALALAVAWIYVTGRTRRHQARFIAAQRRRIAALEWAYESARRSSLYGLEIGRGRVDVTRAISDLVRVHGTKIPAEAVAVILRESFADTATVSER